MALLHNRLYLYCLLLLCVPYFAKDRKVHSIDIIPQTEVLHATVQPLQTRNCTSTLRNAATLFYQIDCWTRKQISSHVGETLYTIKQVATLPLYPRSNGSVPAHITQPREAVATSGATANQHQKQHDNCYSSICRFLR
eukprot:17211-Heterococcus_DN1.PRE.4